MRKKRRKTKTLVIYSLLFNSYKYLFSYDKEENERNSEEDVGDADGCLCKDNYENASDTSSNTNYIAMFT